MRFHAFVVDGRRDAVNPAQTGSKAAPLYVRTVGPGETAVFRLRLASAAMFGAAGRGDSTRCSRGASREADAFYQRVTPFALPEDMRNVQRQAFAGMLWSKQYYRFMVHRWLEGDPAGPPPPEERKHGRNHEWWHLAAGDVLSMPDKWEYPWFAAWDMAFHCVAFAMIDPEFAKNQLLLLTREWYMHPNGQIPAYEWAFGDVNPPVHAWAAIRVYQIEDKMYGRKDRAFLERIFQKLLINFTWWVNRKDAEGNNIFEGGFLGLDNIGAFDRTSGLPSGGQLEQADGTSWMAMYCLNMLAIALELAKEDPVYEDVATQVLRALRLHRRGHQPDGRPRGRPLARRRRLLLRRAQVRRTAALPDQGACTICRRDSRSSRSPSATANALQCFRDFSRARPLVRQVSAGTAARARRHHAPRRRATHPPRHRRFASAPTDPPAPCWTRPGC